MRYRDYSSRKGVSFWSENNALLMLISLNVFGFITLRFIMAVYGLSHLSEERFYTDIFQYFAMPGDLKTFITRPWTFLSSAFSQLDLFLLISNMLWLWTYGFIFQDLTGNRSIIPLYLYSAVAGAVLFLLSFLVFPNWKGAVGAPYYFGATSAIIGIAAGTTLLSPGYRLFPMISGGIPLWVLTAVFGIIDIFYLTAKPAWFLSHLGAAGIGLFFVHALRNGKDWGAWMNQFYDWLVHAFSPKKKNTASYRKKEEVYFNGGEQKGFSKRSNLTQHRIDEILDKINQRGYEKLTEEEKQLLKRASEEDL